MHLYASTHKVLSVARCILTHSHSYAFKRIQMHALDPQMHCNATLKMRTSVHVHVFGMYHECILCVMYLRVKIHCILNVS